MASTGYNKPETLQIKIYGKSGNKTIYEKTKNVVLKANALEKVDFDVSIDVVLLKILIIYFKNFQFHS